MSKEHTSDGRTFLSLAARLRKTRAGFSAVAAATLALAVVGASAHSAAWSQTQSEDRPNIAKEFESPKKNGGAETEAPKRPATPNRRRQTQRPSQPPPQVKVTFTTKEPETEISLILGSLNRQKYLGKINPQRPLTAWLAPGTHDIIASAVGFEKKPQQIDVRPDNTNFEVQLGPATPPPDAAEKATPEPAATPESAADGVTAEKALSEADEVIKQSLDPKTTADVSKEDWQRVLSRLNAALEKEPDNPQLKARADVARGRLALAERDFANARRAFDRAAEAVKDLAAAHQGLGDTYLATNQPDAAFNAYKSASAGPQPGLAYFGMAEALVKQGKKDEANEYYKRARNLGGAPPSVALADARALKRKKRWGPALELFEAIPNSERTAELYLDIGDCYVGVKFLSKAAEAYVKATELDPKSALAFYKYGEVLFVMKKYVESAEAFETSLTLDLTGETINRKRAREMANKAAELAKKAAN